MELTDYNKLCLIFERMCSCCSYATTWVLCPQRGHWGREKNFYFLIYLIFWFVVGYVLLFDFAEIGSRRQPSHREFPWYDFPHVVAPKIYQEWKNKLNQLSTKDIEVPPMLDWDWTEVVGLLREVKPYLTKLFLQDKIRLTCNIQRHLFRIQEPVCVELCVEFFSMVCFMRKDDVNDPENFTFCLGGEDGKLVLWNQLEVWSCTRYRWLHLLSLLSFWSIVIRGFHRKLMNLGVGLRQQMVHTQEEQQTKEKLGRLFINSSIG